MKTLYQSDDGKIFENASACEDYERSRQKSDTFITDSHIYNSGGFPVTQANFYSNIDCICYMDIRTWDDYDWLYHIISEVNHYTMPPRPGRWYYYEELGEEETEWRNYDELLTEVEYTTKVFSQNKKEG